MPLISYYLPLRARAEAHRMMLSYANIPHEIVNFSFAEWGNVKASRELCPFGQLPSIKLENGTIIAQSGAITRYVAKLAGLYPSDPELAAKADMIYELSQEMNLISPIVNFFTKDSDEFKSKYDAYFASLPAWLDAAQKYLADKPFFGGESPLYGDFGLYHIIDLTVLIKPTALDAFPAIKAWFQRVTALSSVQKYLKERPGPSTPGWGKPDSFIMAK